ncbi:protein MON2 homolog isoform X2 [Atheta coriaria]|uniref:protein MON2 homolog isoform X2 n=1 Tax=Dalotia coriaria TaxID=877792 RepID=UPI0031F3B11C
MAFDGRELLIVLQNDLKSLSSETKKKYPHIKESCEEAILKLRNSQSTPPTQIYYVINQIIFPLAQGCETKDMKIIKCCLQIMQRLITQQVLDAKGARFITDALWHLMEAGIEEVKILQSVTLLLTTNAVVHGDTLAKTLVLCFRLHFSKNHTIVNTAGATVRQLVSLVFERVVAEDEKLENELQSQVPPQPRQVNFEELKVPSSSPPKGLPPCAGDAFLLFQDLVQLVNADQPYWLQGMTEMTRTFGLELLESVLTQFSDVFYKNAEFSFLLKERVCALVIKLFSPNIKYRSTIPASVQQATPFDKPYFPISMRLLRVVSILIQKYHVLLITECEIFLSLIVKFLDPDKPSWQRALALEVLHKMTIQPALLNSFCEFYDLKTHTTSIFKDIVNSMGAYVQSLFVNQQLQVGIAIGAGVNQPYGASNTPPSASQAGFISRGIWLPLYAVFPTGQAKSTYLEMLDKTEPPLIPDGYGISVAYACLLEIIRSLQISIGPTHPEDPPDGVAPEDLPQKSITTPANKDLHCQLIKSSWCGLLAALSPLMEASTDEGVTERILKSMQTFAALCGSLELHTPRDAFITAICKSSLPPHYALTVLNAVTPGGSLRTTAIDSVSCQGQNEDYRQQQQIVAVGTPLPTSSVPAGTPQGPVMLTAKNLQSMRTLLSLAHCHGSILGSSWHLVLTTLQHLVWILGLKPSTGGSLKAGRVNDNNSIITTSVMADLPVLSTMLSRLFESSQYLDDVALHHLINALCKLSQEAMELAYNNREPSLFAVAKLLETGIVNMSRIEVLWRPLTNHLLEVCRHPHMRMREWGVEAITYLVKAALLYKHEVPLKENQKLQTLLLGPLSELSSVPHGDVRSRQLDCVLEILHGSGETLKHGWPLVIGIIGAVSEHHGETLIRLAFQCLQLVITDFLPVMPWRCLPLCVDTVAKFGSQTQELNISLTAVGLMWNISDYFHQYQPKLSVILSEDANVFPEFPGIVNMPNCDKLWMCLYTRLGDLCVDCRPAVRKSASQTLFSTISAHGALLKQSTWQAVIWQVLFPLLDRVHYHSQSASTEKVDTGVNILIHHTRNTAQKQWAETQVLTLSGVARVFNTKRQLLQALGDFPRAWSVLLNFIEISALAKNNEVSIAALKSFQEILYSKAQENDNLTTNVEEKEIWTNAWKVWVKIGTEITVPLIEGTLEGNTEDLYLPSQGFLTALVQIFPHVFQHVKYEFTVQDLDSLCAVLTNAVSVPIFGETSQYILVQTNELNLHDGALNAIELVQKEAIGRKQNRMLPGIFKQLLTFSKFSCNPPTQMKNERVAVEWFTVNYIPFGEKALSTVVNLYEATADNDEVIENEVLTEIIRALHLPLSLKYACPSNSTWKLAANSFIVILKVGLPVVRMLKNANNNEMWDQLALTLNEYLFPKTCMPPDRGLDEIVSDEATDCQLIEILRTQVLPFSNCIPKEFILKVVVLLNRGSIHSATNSNMDSETELTLREEFAKTCFETLLQFSLVDGEVHPQIFNQDEGGLAGRLAVTALLHRFQEVLKKYIDDEKTSGKCPLPRYRLSEISFVLKAITTVIISMKKSTQTLDSAAWEQLISLYPYLVECTTTSSTQVSRPLREALLQFCDLLKPPGQTLKISNGNS